jgi:5,10-methylenetetrahydrofolate reductase
MQALIMWLHKCFFDNAKYFEFVAKARNGITVPIIPGIKPLAVQHYKSYLKFSVLIYQKI